MWINVLDELSSDHKSDKFLLEEIFIDGPDPMFRFTNIGNRSHHRQQDLVVVSSGRSRRGLTALDRLKIQAGRSGTKNRLS